MPVLAQVDLDQGIEDAWSGIATFVPKFLGFVTVLLVGWLVATLLVRGLGRVLERIGFDRWVERGVVQRVFERSKYDASGFVSKLVFYGLMLIVLQLAFGIWGPNPVSDLIEGTIAYLPKVLAAVLIIVVAGAIAAAVRDILQSALGTLSYGRPLATAASVAIVAVGVFAALDQLQIAPTIVNGLFIAALAVVAGSAIVAIGGSGIGPMRRQWEKAIGRLETEAPRIQAAAGEAARRREEEAAEAEAERRRAAEVRAEATAAHAAQTDPVVAPGPGPLPRQDDWMDYQA